MSQSTTISRRTRREFSSRSQYAWGLCVVRLTADTCPCLVMRLSIPPQAHNAAERKFRVDEWLFDRMQEWCYKICQVGNVWTEMGRHSSIKVIFACIAQHLCRRGSVFDATGNY